MQDKATWENETDVRATKRATATNKIVLQIIVSPCKSRATKSAQIHAQEQPESALMGRESGKRGGRVEKPRIIRGL